MKLEYLRDTNGIGKVYKKGEIVDYLPWEALWHGMSHEARVMHGIFVHCYGHGEIEVFVEGQDVKRLSDSLEEI